MKLKHYTHIYIYNIFNAIYIYIKKEYQALSLLKHKLKLLNVVLLLPSSLCFNAFLM